MIFEIFLKKELRKLDKQEKVYPVKRVLVDKDKREVTLIKKLIIM